MTPGVSVGGGGVGGFGTVSWVLSGGFGMVSCEPLPGPVGLAGDGEGDFEQAKYRPANVQIVKSIRFIC